MLQFRPDFEYRERLLQVDHAVEQLGAHVQEGSLDEGQAVREGGRAGGREGGREGM
jgi:hypothetical protein